MQRKTLRPFLALLTAFACHGARNFKIHVISELGVLPQYLLSDSLRRYVKKKLKIICLPTKPLKTFKKIYLNSVQRVSAFQIELGESDSVEKIFSGRPFWCHYEEKVQKNDDQVSKRLHARKRNRWASANLVTEHNLREFTFVISLIIYLTYNVPTGRASVKSTVPQSFSAVLFCIIL